MIRSDGERERANHIINRLKACISATEIALKDPIPIGYEPGNAIVQTALELATTLAKMDAYQRVEADQKAKNQKR